MCTRLHQALGFVAVLTASATASSPLLSADLPPSALPPIYGEPPLPPQDVFEGWYLGGTIGGATVSYDFAPAGGTADTSGVPRRSYRRLQLAERSSVLASKVDLMAADIDGSQNFNSGFKQVNPSIDAMADLRLRAGVAVRPRVLLFATFGGAWANADLPVTGPGGGSGSADLLRLERRRWRRSRFRTELGCPFRMPVHRLQLRDGGLPGGQIDYDPDASIYRGSLSYRF